MRHRTRRHRRRPPHLREVSRRGITDGGPHLGKGERRRRQQVLDPGDPAHQAPGDDVGAGLGKQHRSPDAVFPSVARFTRVCAYDRPDTRSDGADRSTPRPQPHPVDLDVTDLHKLLTAIGGPEPYVLVAHSYGGFIATNAIHEIVNDVRDHTTPKTN